MTHLSPAVFTVWSVATTFLGCFFLFHLWRFDRFRCLKWSNTAYTGAFKRLMTYTYFITIPLIMIYSYGLAYIKYSEGYIFIGEAVLPKPYQLYTEAHKKLVYPFMMTFSFGWSFEMVTHLEELCFWLFLIGAGPQQPDWFRSKYFRLWAIGSVIAFVSVPVTTTVYRYDPIVCEAHSILAGSMGDMILTLSFIPVLMRFPRFLQKVKSEGVDSNVILRLHRFFEVNVVRVCFRFIFSVPLLTLAIDGVKPHTHKINESLFWTDMLAMLSAFGCMCSSICTLIIFFPRSFESEYNVEVASQHRSTNARYSWQSGVDFDRESLIERSSFESFVATPAESIKSQQTRRLPRLNFNMRKSTVVRPSNLPDQRRTTPSSRIGSPSLSHLNRAGSMSSVTKVTDTETYLLTDAARIARTHRYESYSNNSQDTMDILDLEGTATPSSRRSGAELIPASKAKIGRSHSGKSSAQSPPVPAYYPYAENDPYADTKYKQQQQQQPNNAPRVLSGIPESPKTQMATMQQVDTITINDNAATTSDMPLRPNRRLPDLPIRGSTVNARQLTAANIRQHDGRHSTVNPLIHNFISPIDFLEKHIVPRKFQHNNSGMGA